MAKMVIEIEHTSTEMNSVVGARATSDKEVVTQDLINILTQMKAGHQPGVINIKTVAVQASRVGTFTDEPTAADTLTINGVAFTARASGAVANEFNLVTGGTAPADAAGNAAALAAAINASTTAGIIDVIVASSSAGALTIKSKQAGKVGNGIILSESMGNFTLAGTSLTGGTQTTNKTYRFGQTESTTY